MKEACLITLGILVVLAIPVTISVIGFSQWHQVNQCEQPTGDHLSQSQLEAYEQCQTDMGSNDSLFIQYLRYLQLFFTGQL